MQTLQAIRASLLAIMISMIATAAWAKEPQVPYEEWDSRSAEDSDGPVCYLYIYPSKQRKLDFKRGIALVFLTFNSLDPEASEFAADLGRSTIVPEAAQLLISEKSFDLVFRSGKAWLRDVKKEGELLQLFKTTNTFVLSLTYTSGTVIDQFSSVRFAKAMEELRAACKMKS